MTEEDQPDEQKKALLTLAIELGDKKKQLLNIYLDSKPEQLAYDFCLQNNLDFDSMQNLTEEIRNALSNYKNEPQNQETKNQASENIEDQNEKNKNDHGGEGNNSDMENHEEAHEMGGEEEKENHQEQEVEQEYEELTHEENNMNENAEHNKENESGPKTEEVSEENHEQDNQAQYQVEEELHGQEGEGEHENEHQEKESEQHENEEHLEENFDANANSDTNKNPELNLQNNEQGNINDKLNENKDNKKEENENEDELAKEEEGDEMMDMDENGEEDENIVSYLSPTICFQNKQRKIAEPKPKQEFPDFDTTYKKKDKTEEFVKELHEEVVNHLNINQNNQKYLPKDYYDNPEGKNFGERLYQRELRLKEEAMEKIRNKVEIENKAKEENLTFTPKINEINVVYLQNRKMNKMQYNDEKRIINYKDYLRSREEHVRNKYIEETEKENTFMPKIDKNSEKMAGNRSLQVPRYEQLYKKKVDLKKLEQKIYDNPNMFKPQINKNYKGIKPSTKGDNNKDKDKDKNKKKMAEYASLTFEERQKKFKEMVEEKKGKLLEQKNINIDSKTGKKYFKPTINKNKKLDDERKNKPVFNELYSDSEKYKIKKEELEKKVLELEQFNTEFKASARSEEMYDKQKNIAFEKIFKRLDNDKDGKISINDINLTGISKRIVKIISPIIDELKNNKNSISSVEFTKKCEGIYSDLNYADKKELFIYSMGGPIKSVYDTEQYVRKKKVDRKSKGKSLRSTAKENIINDKKGK